jgi:hypothetical protein
MNPFMIGGIAIALWRMLKKDKYTVLGQVDGNNVEISVRLAMLSGGHCEITDSDYQTYSLKDLDKFMSHYHDQQPYLNQFWDCDNFAIHYYDMIEIAMPGCLCGFCHVTKSDGKHALNFIFDENNEMWLVEPQNSTRFKKPDDWQIYFAYI